MSPPPRTAGPWTRTPSQDGYSDYRRGEWLIVRHDVDDRDYDGGGHYVYWLLCRGDVRHPVDQFNRLSDAKAAAQ